MRSLHPRRGKHLGKVLSASGRLDSDGCSGGLKMMLSFSDRLGGETMSGFLERRGQLGCYS